MKTLLIVLLLAVPAFAQEVEKPVVQEKPTYLERIVVASDECIQDCNTEFGICNAGCEDNANCFARCAEAQGRCISRCKH